MSTFQEFGPLSERRRAELTQKRRKKIMFAGASFSVLLVLAVVGVAAVAYHNPNSDDPKDTKASQIHSVSKSVSMICSTTDYKDTCESSLNKAVGNSSSDPKPKDIVKAAVSVLFKEVGKVFSKAKAFKSDDPRIKGAVEVCNRLFKDAEYELQNTVDVISKYKIEELPKKSYLLRTWLSAVMSYQVTCVDAFPEGDLKKKMKDGMKVSKEMTSNALAILGKAMAFLSDMKIAGLGKRRLLAEEEDGLELHEDGTPSWLSEGERRQLRGKATADMTPNVTVAKDGSGEFKTINAALAAMPKVYAGRYSIYVKTGVYDEYVEVTNFMVNVTMFGDGSKKSIITGKKNYVDGTQTFMTASFAALGEGFVAIGLGFQNTAGPAKQQAVAIRVQSDRAVFLNCRFDGFQDTLYVQTHRQYYRSCVITGTIDFIFGDASAVFQNCVIQVLRPLAGQFNAVTAQGREDRQEVTGFILHNCKIVADPTLEPVKADFKSFLGRPWKIASRTIIMESQIDDFIAPVGYMAWEGQSDWTQLYYAEYMNTGPGASTAGRINWPGFKVITDRKEAMAFTVANFLKGGEWIKKVNAPVHMTLYH